MPLSFCLSLKRQVAGAIKDNRGIAAVEFALIVPVIVAMGLMAIVLSYKLFERQRLESAVAAVTFFLDDQVLNGDISRLQPVKALAEDGKTVLLKSGPAMQTATLVLADAFRSDATLTLQKFTVFCGCPNSAALTSENPDEVFFTRYDPEPVDEKPLCSRTCSDGSRARVLAEIDILASTVDFFGQPYTLHEQSVTRLR